MISVTKRLRRYAEKHLSVQAKASDEAVRRAVGAAMLRGKLSSTKVAAMTAADPTDPKPKPPAKKEKEEPESDDLRIRRAVNREMKRRGLRKRSSGITPYA